MVPVVVSGGVRLTLVHEACLTWMGQTCLDGGRALRRTGGWSYAETPYVILERT